MGQSRLEEISCAHHGPRLQLILGRGECLGEMIGSLDNFGNPFLGEGESGLSPSKLGAISLKKAKKRGRRAKDAANKLDSVK